MLIEEDRKEIVECIGKATEQVLDKSIEYSNDTTQKYADAIKAEGIDPICDKITELVIDVSFLKGVLEKVGYINDDIYNKYVESFKKLNPVYFKKD